VDKRELEALRLWLSDTVERRRKLGGYSQESEAILNLFEVALKLATHIKPNKPKAKKK